MLRVVMPRGGAGSSGPLSAHRETWPRATRRAVPLHGISIALSTLIRHLGIRGYVLGCKRCSGGKSVPGHAVSGTIAVLGRCGCPRTPRVVPGHLRCPRTVLSQDGQLSWDGRRRSRTALLGHQVSRDTTCPWTFFSAPERPPLTPDEKRQRRHGSPICRSRPRLPLSAAE